MSLSEISRSRPSLAARDEGLLTHGRTRCLDLDRHPAPCRENRLTPAVGFWNNFAGRCVIRGGLGLLIPIQGGGDDTLISQLAIGQTLTDHDVPLFGDFTYYLSTVVNTSFNNSNHTSVPSTFD